MGFGVGMGWGGIMLGERSCSICRRMVVSMVERLMVMFMVLVLVSVGGLDVIRWGLV